MSGRLTMRACTVGVIAGALAACGARARGADGVPASTIATGAPALLRLAPETVDIGRGEIPTLVLTGRAFVPGGEGGFGTGGGNTVRVGPLQLTGIPSDSAGTTIRFALPLSYNDSTLRGRPAAFIPGQYPVSVTTPRGTSNVLMLTMKQ